MAKEIYEKARYKPAECLAQGKHFSINRGNYQIFPGQGTCLGQICREAKILSEKGRYITRIEVTYQNREIFQHFGRTEQFKVYGIEAGKISSSQIVASDGLGHGALAGFPFYNGIDVWLCGGIGGGAQTALTMPESIVRRDLQQWR